MLIFHLRSLGLKHCPWLLLEFQRGTNKNDIELGKYDVFVLKLALLDTKDQVIYLGNSTLSKKNSYYPIQHLF